MVLYCMSKYGLKFDLDNKTRSKGKLWELDECQTFITRFHQSYPVLSNWIKEQQNFAKRNGFVRTAFGRVRPLPDALSTDWQIKNGALRQAVNTPIQSASNDLMVIGICNMINRLDRKRTKLMMTVHDSVVVEMDEDYVHIAHPIMKECLEHPLFQGRPLDFINIPLVADFQIGKKYGEMKDYKG